MPTEEVRLQQAEPEVKDPVKEEPAEDMGLGMSNFLTTPSPEDSPDGKKEEVKGSDEEGKGGDEDEAKKPDEKDDKKPDEKAAAKPEGDEKPKETPSPDAAKDDVKKEAKKEDEPKPEDKPKVNYESPDNPYVKRHRDTQNWASDLNKKYQQQEKSIAILQKQLAGTYDEEKDNPQPTAEEIEGRAEVKGRANASRQAAVEKFGEEKTAADLDTFYNIFGDDPHVQGSIMSQDQPVIEAIKMLRRHEFFEEYGYEPVEIIEKVKVKILAEERTKIVEEETAKLASRIKAKEGEPAGLAGLTAKTGDSTVEKSKEPQSLKSMFDN